MILKNIILTFLGLNIPKGSKLSHDNFELRYAEEKLDCELPKQPPAVAAQNYLELLPPEILLLIFEFLEPKDCAVFASLYKKAYLIGENPTIWKSKLTDFGQTLADQCIQKKNAFYLSLPEEPEKIYKKMALSQIEHVKIQALQNSSIYQELEKALENELTESDKAAFLGNNLNHAVKTRILIYCHNTYSQYTNQIDIGWSSILTISIINNPSSWTRFCDVLASQHVSNTLDAVDTNIIERSQYLLDCFKIYDVFYWELSLSFLHNPDFQTRILRCSTGIHWLKTIFSESIALFRLHKEEDRYSPLDPIVFLLEQKGYRQRIAQSSILLSELKQCCEDLQRDFPTVKKVGTIQSQLTTIVDAQQTSTPVFAP
jgi:hypothetical protein